jgi:hypothetical protein
MFEILRIFYYALVNNDKHNEYSHYVMKFPFFLKLIIMFMLKINEIILYKIKFCFWVLFYAIISFLAHKNIRVID